MKSCPLDRTFGPAVGQCRGGFDFTLTFEESILGFVPQILLILLTPIRFLTLRGRRVKLFKNSHLGFLKTVTTNLYVISSLISVVLWTRHENYRTQISVAFAITQLMGALAITVLSRVEHTRSMRPSHLLQFFLLIMLMCNAVRLRTLFLMQYSNALVVSASTHTFLTGALLLLESLDKALLLPTEPSSKRSPEETLGLFSKGFFWYLNGLFWTGKYVVYAKQDRVLISRCRLPQSAEPRRPPQPQRGTFV
jgi:ATP-binding cassette subfamily C (CFTR/MRP) protein 1